jgi:hypothetical protein
MGSDSLLRFMGWPSICGLTQCHRCVGWRAFFRTLIGALKPVTCERFDSISIIYTKGGDSKERTGFEGVEIFTK